MKIKIIIISLFILAIIIGGILGASSQSKNNEGIGIEKYTYEEHEYLIFYQLSNGAPISAMHSGACTKIHK